MPIDLTSLRTFIDTECWSPLSFPKIRVNRFLIKIIDVPCHGCHVPGSENIDIQFNNRSINEPCFASCYRRSNFATTIGYRQLINRFVSRVSRSLVT